MIATAATIFDSLLPAGLAIAGFLIFIGLFALSRRGGQTMGQLLVFLGGIVLIFVAFDFQESIGDAQIALAIAAAGLGTMVLSAIEMVRGAKLRG